MDVPAANETEKTRQVAHTYIDALERRDWAAFKALLDESVVYEMPQSRERITGRDRFLQFNQEYPGDWHLSTRRVVADGRFASLWIDARVGDDPQSAIAWLELSADGLISRVTDYWPEPYEPLAGRAHLVERY
jgi:ketosteroid isomerase-like protein